MLIHFITPLSNNLYIKYAYKRYYLALINCGEAIVIDCSSDYAHITSIKNPMLDQHRIFILVIGF